MNHRPQIKYKGFTLAEAMIATVILGIAAVGLLLPYTTGATVQAEGMCQTLGAKLASDLMEEIVTTPADQIVATFDGYSESKGQVEDATGTVFTDSNYANLSRDASCALVYVPQESEAEEAIFILVTVRVYYSGRQIAILNRLISK